MPDGRLELTRDALCSAVLNALKRTGQASLGGEPGVGLGWVVRRIAAEWPGAVFGLSAPSTGSIEGPNLTIIRFADRTQAPGARLVLGGPTPEFVVEPLTYPTDVEHEDDADSGAETLLRDRLAQGTFAAVTDFADVDIRHAASVSEGLPAVITAIARRARRLGLRATLDMLTGHSAQVLPVEALKQGLSRDLDDTQMRALACISVCHIAVTEADALVMFEISAEALQSLADHHLIRQLGVGRVRCSRLTALAVRQLAPAAVAEAEAALCRWGADLRDAAFWVGRPAAAEALWAHLGDFRRIARRSVLAIDATSVDALIAWGTACRDDASLPDFVCIASDVLGRIHGGAQASCSPTRIAILALTLAEAARLAGLHGVLSDALTAAQQTHPFTWRVAVIAARAAFNQGQFDQALARVHPIQTGCPDLVAQAHATMITAWVERAREAPDAARLLSAAAHQKFDILGGDINAAQARLNAALVELSVGQWAEAVHQLSAAQTGNGHGSDQGQRHSFLCLAYEIAGRYNAAYAATQAGQQCRSNALFRAIWRTYQARVEIALGRQDAARESLRRATLVLEEADAHGSLTTVLCTQALLEVQAEHDDIAHARLAMARARCQPTWSDRLAIIDLTQHALDFLLQTRPCPGEAYSKRPKMLATTEQARPPVGQSASVHLRAMYSLVRRLIAQSLDRGARHDGVLLNGATQTCTFRGLECALSRRPTLWRLLQALATQTNLSDDALFQVVWQGERAQPSAAMNRLRVAVSDLRKLSRSRALVLRSKGRYRLGGPPIALAVKPTV